MEKKGLEQAISLLAANSLTESEDRGFVLVQRSRGSASFKFYERTSVVVTRVDIDGNTSHDQVETLGVCSFAIVSVQGATFLRAENPGKTLRTLFNTLGQLIGLGFTAAPIVFAKYAPKRFISTFSAHKLISLKVRGTIPGTSLYATMEFDSKDGLISQQLPLPDQFEFQVTQAIYDIRHKLTKGQIGYLSNGTVRVAGELSHRLIELVEDELVQLERRGNLFKP